MTGSPPSATRNSISHRLGKDCKFEGRTRLEDCDRGQDEDDKVVEGEEVVEEEIVAGEQDLQYIVLDPGLTKVWFGFGVSFLLYY